MQELLIDKMILKYLIINMIQNNIHGVLLCGGRGSRLRTLTGNHLPKSLMPVAERPLIQYTAEQIGAVAIKLL